MRKNIKASLVNLTLNMRYRNDKNIKFVVTKFVFFSSSKCTKIRFWPPRPRWGELTTLPRPLVGWGGDTPSPFPSPIDAFGVSVLRPPQHKILATPVTEDCA